uniref:Ig-like domain-containing protein n=1 Tax=Pygocentrus nattereri TaxID=42514 RepID=A0A3B4C613_PYGNA
TITPLENKVQVDALEDETVTLSCKYEGSAAYLYWYRQYSGSRPEFLLRIDPDTNAVAHATPRFPRLDTKLNGRTLILEISSAAISDSALYYCAMEPTVTENPATLYKNSLTDKASDLLLGFLSGWKYSRHTALVKPASCYK